ncbi:glucose-1-phosphate thymidylyltransferase [Candidatus Woesebacteria bacterium]|nr:MAG: glucose-1-phosphate thymidylyltransferase [Candidatus Woesebacteria bacterium]
MKAIIPTGGRGTRMQPLTFSTNKHFIPVANKPLIFYPIESVVEADIKDILITYNPGWLDVVKSYLGDGSKWGAKFTYVLQEKPIGLANVVQVCEEKLNGDSFVYHLGDNIFTKGIKEVTDYFRKNKPNGMVTMVHHPENSRLGVPYFSKTNRLIKYVEKPKNSPHDFAVPGLYFGDHNVFKCFTGKNKIVPSARGEYEIPSVFQWLIDNKYRVDVIEYKGKWLDPGKFNDWIESNRYLLDEYLVDDMGSKIDRSTKIIGRVSVGKNCKIRNSEIKGPVSISDNVEISDSYIGPYSSISSGCVIEKSHLEDSVLMENVRIINVKQPINESMIGNEAEVYDLEDPTHWIKLFIGEKSKVRV